MNQSLPILSTIDFRAGRPVLLHRSRLGIRFRLFATQLKHPLTQNTTWHGRFIHSRVDLKNFYL
jgi:hypothetical protein